jgi:hypothetical protein
MTQNHEKQQVEVTQQVAAKLQAFCDALTDDERLALDRAAHRLLAGVETDTQGHMIRQPKEEPVVWQDPAEGKVMPYVIFVPTLKR